jgi:hypothetical protein
LAVEKDVEPLGDIGNEGGAIGDRPEEVRHRFVEVALDLVGAGSKKQHVAIGWVIAVGTEGKRQNSHCLLAVSIHQERGRKVGGGCPQALSGQVRRDDRQRGQGGLSGHAVAVGLGGCSCPIGLADRGATETADRAQRVLERPVTVDAGELQCT